LKKRDKLLWIGFLFLVISTVFLLGYIWKNLAPEYTTEIIIEGGREIHIRRRLVSLEDIIVLFIGFCLLIAWSLLVRGKYEVEKPMQY